MTVISVLRYLSRQVSEIAADPALRIYGAALASSHVLHFWSWRVDQKLEGFITRDAPTLCWPFFERCHAYRVLDDRGVWLVLGVYVGLALLALAFFLSGRSLGRAYAALLAVSALHVSIVLQDFGLTLNHHYMHAFVTLVYLFVPHKRSALQCLIVAFYFWAGTLKLQGEWLSGAMLSGHRSFPIPAALLPAACVYVAALELVIVPGLLARRGWIFWSAFAQLLLFHAFSWSIVGFHYPVQMFALIAIFPLCRALPAAEPGASLRSLFRGREPWPVYALLAIFSLLQLVPRAMPGDAAVTGEGRIFALDMFDGIVDCEGSLLIHGAGGETRREVISRKHLHSRIRCDPIAYFNIAHQRCRDEVGNPEFRDLDLSLMSRRSFESERRPVIALRNFCRVNPSYELWRPNWWILRHVRGPVGRPGSSRLRHDRDG